MSLFLAIDGGNSKTDVLLAATDGTVLSHVTGQDTNHQAADCGIDEAMRRLDDLVLLARQRASIGEHTRLALTVACLAGVDLPVEHAALTEAVAATGWAEESTVDNDTVALLRAGADGASTDAVAVVCGAGINCVARAADGRMVRFPALGEITGDWGGGLHLGMLALWHATRCEDGRGPATALVDAVAAHFGRERIADVGAAVHLGEIHRARLGELAPLLFRVAAAGDEVARSVVVRQGEEVVALVTAALRRLGLLAAPVVVVLGGGVLRARDPLLLGVIHERLLAAVPRATITVVTDPPVVGAALLALDALGADAAAHEALRTNARHRR